MTFLKCSAAQYGLFPERITAERVKAVLCVGCLLNASMQGRWQ